MNNRTILAGTLPTVAGLTVSALMWTQVSDPMAIHWDASGDPNGWAPRALGLVMLPLVSLAVSAITGWAMRRKTTTERVRVAALLGIGGFHLGLHALMLQAGMHPEASISMTGVLILMGALFGGMGLVMPHLRQNRWAGVRTPWTLGDEVNWKVTHRFAAWSMGISGAVCMIAAAVLSPPVSMWVGMAVVLIGSLLPLGYSYLIHRLRRR